MSTHTPGQWVAKQNRWGAYVVTDGSGEFVCEARSTDDDAHLIAAAPDLLRELSHLVRLLQPMERDGRLNVPGLATLNGARAAIAKATETP